MTNRTAEFLAPVSERGVAPSSPDFQGSQDFRSLEHLGQLFDVTQDLLCVIGFDDHIKYLNGSWESVLGYTRAELMTSSIVERVHADDRQATAADIEKVRAGTPTKSFANRLRCKNGTYKWISWSATASAAQQSIYVSGRDITENRRSEEHILRLAQALEHSSEMICMCDTAGRAVFANQALLEASGYREEEILGKPLAETLLSNASPASLPEEIHRAIIGDGKWSGECLQRRRNGPDLPVSLSIGMIKDRDGHVTGTYCISHDVAERRRAERELAERTAFLDSLVENCPVGIVAIGVDHSVRLCNPAFEKIFRYRQEEIIGRPLYDLLTTPAIRAEVDTNRLRFKEGKPTHTVTKRARSDGSLVDVEAYSVPLGDPSIPTGALVLYQDITERKCIEQQLRQAQKIEAVGQLAGGIAHDFNNLLMVILGYTTVLTESPEIGPSLQSKMREVSKAANRAASLTAQLLAFSRQQVLEPKVIGLNLVVEDVKKMLGRLINEDIALVTELDPTLGHMKADQGQIEQVIVNLAVNARDAMPKGGTLTIKTANVQVDEKYSRIHEPMLPGSYVGLTVSDTGMGIDAHTQSRVFEPFFTTKEQGKGTGLGLATVYGVVKQSGGFIWLTSEVGRGATFEIFFPRVHAPLEDLPSDPSRILPTRGSENILLVEDDEALRALILSSLRDAGYTVIEAADGVDGLRIARREGGAIDLVLTDVVMPGMSGPKMADEISALYPETQVLYMSGYSEFGGGHQEILRQGRTLLQKPFEIRSLVRQVREILESPRKLGRSHS
jgi:two-component system, cell cycle sensor histidine kinase and response regulator CckA